MTELEGKVKGEVEKIIDPSTGLSFGQIGLITGVKEQEPGVVEIVFVPTSPFCPIAFKFASDIKLQLKRLTDLKKHLFTCMDII
jgi:metal-sulfur cluster biosynthetic enzyme